LGGQRSATRVDPAAQKNADRHIGDELRVDRALTSPQLAAELVAGIRGGTEPGAPKGRGSSSRPSTRHGVSGGFAWRTMVCGGCT
jgi:hypothetical protein